MAFAKGAKDMSARISLKLVFMQKTIPVYRRNRLNNKSLRGLCAASIYMRSCRGTQWGL